MGFDNTCSNPKSKRSAMSYLNPDAPACYHFEEEK